jgi:regulatory protein
MIYTVSEALSKLKKYCAYQERSQHEVRLKLYASLLTSEEKEYVISELISENYLNEERFARSFCRGKFRIKRWGKKKIIAGLRAKGVSDYCIRQGMMEISESEYRKVLFEEITKELKTADKQRAARRVMAKGFEPQLVMQIIEKNPGRID